MRHLIPKMEKLTDSAVKSWFDLESVVGHYTTAAINIGLWQSEEIVLQRVFGPGETILEVGCGTGRISLGLWELGYRGLLGTDFSRDMITKARELGRKLEYSVPFRVADATRLPFEDGIFDGVIFGFNGLMQIPGRPNRRTALAEMNRVVGAGGKAVLTTHDRATGGHQRFWTEEQSRWQGGEQDRRLIEFGDRIVESDHGPVYIHIPSRDEVRDDLESAGWNVVEDAMRSEICAETAAVEAFAVDCRFWVVEKPA